MVQRGMCFTPVASGIESNFSRMDSTLGQRRLGAAEGFEAQSVCLLVTSFSDDQLADLVKGARVIYEQAFQKHTRIHTKHRCDKGIGNKKRGKTLKHHGGLLTETAWMRRLHESVVQSSTVRAASGLEHDDAACYWTEKHGKEQSFQIQKANNRKVEAYRQGLILPDACCGRLEKTLLSNALP